MLSISLIAAFPELVEHALDFGVTGRARQQGLWRWQGFALHDFAADARKSIDARPAAGGPGMVLMPAPLDAALAAARTWHGEKSLVVFMSPDGAPLEQNRVRQFAQNQHITFVAGRYEGIDQRWIDANVDAIVSIGDYVLSGGELAAAVVIDSCVRLLPGALGDAESATFESFADGKLDWPQYALTASEDQQIPAQLANGDHATVNRWRIKQALIRTWMRRPDLLARANLSLEETSMLDEITEIGLESKTY
ncbi:MAG: tRNA (guanosine(37)-N1)-methyltransferase TrmD [Casimicrobium sp.]|jgi:tRNA (guanine37-N1)-methyltransferase